MLKYLEFTKLALKSLFRRKFRTFLTSFAIFVGIFVVVVLLSLSNGAQNIIISQITDQFDLKTIFVFKKGSLNTNFFSTNVEEEVEQPKIITNETITAISQINNVANVSPVLNIFARKLEFVDKEFDKRVVNSAVGAGWDILDDEVITIYAGKLKNLAQNEILLTKDLVDAYGKNYEDVIGKEVLLVDQPALFGSTQAKLISDRKYVVSGVVEKIRNFVYLISVDEALDTLVEKNKYDSVEDYINTVGYQSLFVRATSEQFVQSISAAIKDLEYDTSTLEDVLKLFNTIFQFVPLVFSFIGAIAIFISSIGITNSMMMSIYERTREIGVMKSVGARNKDILILFTIESGILGAIGGTAAIIFSLLFMSLINNFFASDIALKIGVNPEKYIFVYDYKLIILTFSISVLIGVIAGLYPAYRASKLNPVDALKVE